LDATQRHFSIDWNTEVQGNIPSAPHVVDAPDHSNQNMAGSVLIRSYLEPAWTCNGGPGNCSPPSCPAGSGDCYTLPSGQGTPVPFQYVIVRDVNTGCALNAENVMNGLLYPNNRNADNAVISFSDLSTIPNVTGWLDISQLGLHSTVANTTPQSCYADGGVATPGNAVAWARSPEFIGLPAPDDSYIGGAIPRSTLTELAPNTQASPCKNSQGQPSTDGCLIRLQFELPSTPTTPCGNCYLTGSEQLRYMSLTFGYQPSTCSGVDSWVANPDGFDGVNGCTPNSIVSLADTAFAANADGSGNRFVTLLVNVGESSQGQTALPAWLQQSASGATGQTWGVAPITTGTGSQSLYSAWSVQGASGAYTVLDLTQFPSFQNVCSAGGGFACSEALLLNIRNTLPNMAAGASFPCSGAAVPFSTAEYTPAGGLMGPYVPLVDYVDPSTLSPAGPALPLNLPPSSACGVLPTGTSAAPNVNVPTSSDQENFPQQYWSSSAGAAPPYLSCPGGLQTTPQPEVYFAATQYTVPATTYESDNGVNCATDAPHNPCDQLIFQEAQTTELAGGAAWQPTLPVTIVGVGFGQPPGVTLPLTVAGSATNPFGYLDIQNDNASGLHQPWHSSTDASCQVEIFNWTDTSITLSVLETGLTDLYGVTPSPLTDASPLDFEAPPLGSSTGCPSQAGDNLTFTVTNPQSGQSFTLTPPVPVYASGTQPN